MTGKARRRTVALTVVAAMLATTASVLGPIQAKANPVKTQQAITRSERGLIATYYESKLGLEKRGRKARTLPAAVVLATPTVGDDYFTSFRDSYLADPDLSIRGMKVSSTVLKKKIIASGVQYRVSVSLYFQLHDINAGQTFEGGETMDHLLTTERSNSANRLTIRRDKYLGISTSNPNLKAAADLPSSTESDLPQAQLSERQQETRNVTPLSSAFPTLNYQSMVKYASLWTDSSHSGSLNSKYGNAGDNCTNFISQALHVGGWPIRDTIYPNRKKLKYWDCNMTGPGKFTYTWSVANSSYRRIHQNAGKRLMGHKLHDAWLGDIVYADWNLGNSKYDGSMDHAMIATRRTSSTPYFSQKSGNRHNVSPSQVVKNTKAGGATKYKWYVIRT